jgi:hypothetical protein
MQILSKHTLLLLGLAFGIVVAEFFLLEGTMGISLPGDRSPALSRVTVKLKGTQIHYTTDNKRFSVIDDYDLWLLLRESFWTDRQPGIEGSNATVTVEAYDGQQLSKLKWKLQAPGDRGEVFDTFYKVTKYGCCDAPNKYTYYSLWDGRKLYSANVDDLFWVFGAGKATCGGVFGDTTRFVSYDEQPSMDPDGRLTGFAGLLQFGSAKRIIREIEIHATSGLASQGLTVLHHGKRYSPGSPSDLYREESADIASLSSFAISLRFSDGSELTLPVENDDVSLRGVSIPSRFTLKTR